MRRIVPFLLSGLLGVLLIVPQAMASPDVDVSLGYGSVYYYESTSRIEWPGGTVTTDVFGSVTAPAFAATLRLTWPVQERFFLGTRLGYLHMFPAIQSYRRIDWLIPGVGSYFDILQQQDLVGNLLSGDLLLGISRPVGEQGTLQAYLLGGYRNFAIQGVGGSGRWIEYTDPGGVFVTSGTYYTSVGATETFTSPAFGVGLRLAGFRVGNWTSNLYAQYASLSGVTVANNVVVPGSVGVVTTSGREWVVGATLERPLTNTLSLSLGYEGTFTTIDRSAIQTATTVTGSTVYFLFPGGGYSANMFKASLVWRF